VRGQSQATGAVAGVFVLLLGYAALGVAYQFQPRLLLLKTAASSVGMSTGRTADEPEESRDLVRVNGRPIPRQEARILFGYDTLFNIGAVALPILLAIGTRRREWLLVGLIGIVAVALCNVTGLGRVLNIALPTPLLWRARWMLPSLICVAALAGMLWEALAAVLRRRSDGPGALVSTFNSPVVMAMFALMLSRTDGTLLKIGETPRTLTKFSDDVHGLAKLLGGQEAAPLVWGSRDVTRELPQLMPNVKLVLSREKIMLRSGHPQYRSLVLSIREKFRRETATRADIEMLLQLYPVEHMVIDQPFSHIHPATTILRELGWEEVGASGRYRVWRKEQGN
jgi:hypothetical protein